MKTCQELHDEYKKIKELKENFETVFAAAVISRNFAVAETEKEKLEKAVKVLRKETEDLLLGVRLEARFPKEKFPRIELEIGGKTKDQLIQEMKENGIQIFDYAMKILNSPDFQKSILQNPDETNPAKQIPKVPESITLIRLKLSDLGFTEDNNPTTDQLYACIEKLQLQLCPPEVGPNYRLKYADQPMGEWVQIGMKQITGRDGYRYVFRVVCSSGGLWLDDSWAEPLDAWYSDNEFVFRLRK